MKTRRGPGAEGECLTATPACFSFAAIGVLNVLTFRQAAISCRRTLISIVGAVQHINQREEGRETSLPGGVVLVQAPHERSTGYYTCISNDLPRSAALPDVTHSVLHPTRITRNMTCPTRAAHIPAYSGIQVASSLKHSSPRLLAKAFAPAFGINDHGYPVSRFLPICMHTASLLAFPFGGESARRSKSSFLLLPC